MATDSNETWFGAIAEGERAPLHRFLSVAHSTDGSLREIGYVELDQGSGITITGTSSSAATTVVGDVEFTFDGGPVWAEFFSPAVYLPTTTSGTMEIALYEGATLVAGLGYFHNVASPHGEGPMLARVRMDNEFSVAAPTSGAHTYTVKAWVSDASSGPVVGGGDDSSGAPVYLRFTPV